MKEFFKNIITKITRYIKIFIGKIVKNIEFESSKNQIIKVMYSSVLENKKKQRDILLSELSIIKQENKQLSKKIILIKEESLVYNKKINTLNEFQQFILNNQN